MSLTKWARRARACRRALSFAVLVTLAAAGVAGAYAPRREGAGGMRPPAGWRPMLEADMAGMPDGMQAMEQATPHQRAVARRLMRRTLSGTARYSTPARARRAGYRPAGRWSRVGMRHFNSRRAESDGRILDPSHPESLLFWRAPDGRLHLAAAMFRAPSDRPPPQMENPLFHWHAHHVCVRPVPGATREMPTRHCRGGLVARYGVSQMLHLWFTRDLMTAYAMQPPVDALSGAFGLR